MNMNKRSVIDLISDLANAVAILGVMWLLFVITPS